MSEEAKARDTSIRELVEAAFARIKDLGNESRTLFPGGLASLDLDVSYGGDGEARRVSLKMSAVPPAPLKEVPSEEIIEEEDSEDESEFGILFNSEGHHLVVLITEKDLQARAQGTLNNIMAILDAVGRSLLDAAVFPDVIRNSQPHTKPFHFVDIEFRANGPAEPPLPAAPHVLSKLTDFTSFLASGTGSIQAKADAISWLIHLYGDVHQPLHCITRITNRHPAPDGDRGGNSFRLKGTPKNLHSLWDSSASVLRNVPEETLAAEIFQKHTRVSLAADLAVTDSEKWARSSFKLAKAHAYGPLTENSNKPPKPSKAYLRKMEEVGQKQAALAAYRLADRFVQLFP